MCQERRGTRVDVSAQGTHLLRTKETACFGKSLAGQGFQPLLSHLWFPRILHGNWSQMASKQWRLKCLGLNSVCENETQKNTFKKTGKCCVLTLCSHFFKCFWRTSWLSRSEREKELSSTTGCCLNPAQSYGDWKFLSNRWPMLNKTDFTSSFC